jgi:hypothetical protein
MDKVLPLQWDGYYVLGFKRCSRNRQHHVIQTWVSGGLTPRILNIGIRWSTANEENCHEIKSSIRVKCFVFFSSMNMLPQTLQNLKVGGLGCLFWTVLKLGRYMPVYHTGTTFCSWISCRYLTTHTVPIYLFSFFFLAVYLSFAFKNYTSTSEFPFRALVLDFKNRNWLLISRGGTLKLKKLFVLLTVSFKKHGFLKNGSKYSEQISCRINHLKKVKQSRYTP